MEWVETTGETVAQAIERALERLGVKEADAEIVVLEEPKRSIFGLRRSEARIRARVRPVQAKAKRPARRGPTGEQRPRRRGGERQEETPDSTSAAGGRNGAGRTRAGETAGGRSKGRPKQQQPERLPSPVGGEQEPQGVRASSAEAAEAGSRPRSRSRNRQAGGSRTAGDRERSPRETTTEEEQMSIESQAELAEQFVRGVVERFGLEAELTRTIEDDTVRIDVSGGSLGLLIGPRGATVDALQELARTAVQRRGEDASVRLVVDVGGYRVRRAAALQQFARRVAAEVAESGQPQALDPMSAADRKIVHDTVNEIGSVHTTSEGQDPRRYVVIHPGGAESHRSDSDS